MNNSRTFLIAFFAYLVVFALVAFLPVILMPAFIDLKANYKILYYILGIFTWILGLVGFGFLINKLKIILSQGRNSLVIIAQLLGLALIWIFRTDLLEASHGISKAFGMNLITSLKSGNMERNVSSMLDYIISALTYVGILLFYSFFGKKTDD
ncbi:hypothetical protein [Pedobacter sp.]